jgi:hypothetical protein
MVDPETFKVTLVVSHGGDMDITQYIAYKYPLETTTDFVQSWLGILDLGLQAAKALVHILEIYHCLYTKMDPSNFRVNSATGHLTVVDLCATHAADLEKRPKLCVSGFYCPPEASVQVLLSAIGGAATLEKTPAATLDMIFASVPASVRSSLKRWFSPTSISPIHPASMVWSFAAMFYDLLFPQAAVAAQQLATRYDSDHPLVPAAAAAAAAASSFKGKVSSYLVCLNKDLTHLEQLRPYPALHTLMSGALSVEPYHRTVTITAMLSLLPAAKEELLQHKAREQQQAAAAAAQAAVAAAVLPATATTTNSREGEMQQRLGELMCEVADLQQQLAAARAGRQLQGVKSGEGEVVLPIIKLRKSSGGYVDDASEGSEGGLIEPGTPAAAVSCSSRPRKSNSNSIISTRSSSSSRLSNSDASSSITSSSTRNSSSSSRLSNSDTNSIVGGSSRSSISRASYSDTSSINTSSSTRSSSSNEDEQVTEQGTHRNKPKHTRALQLVRGTATAVNAAKKVVLQRLKNTVKRLFRAGSSSRVDQAKRGVVTIKQEDCKEKLDDFNPRTLMRI